MKILNLTGVCASLLALAACSSSEVSPTLSVSNASIFAEPNANLNSAIAVDVVLVYNDELLGALAKLPAQKYFEASDQLRLDNPSLLDVWRWELVPGQVVEDFKLETDKGKAFGGLVFANYLTPGDHRVKIPPSGDIKILLAKDDLISVAAGSFDGLKVGKTASDDVPSGMSHETAERQKKIPCGHPLSIDKGNEVEPNGRVKTQTKKVTIKPLKDEMRTKHDNQ